MSCGLQAVLCPNRGHELKNNITSWAWTVEIQNLIQETNDDFDKSSIHTFLKSILESCNEIKTDINH